MGVKGCWTCRERKVRCDWQRPKCGNCTKSRRDCQGYGVQLSWPRAGDTKRAIISHNEANSRSSNINRFLNTSFWDTSLSEELENGRISAHHSRTLFVPRPTYLSPTAIHREELQLLDFFSDSRSLILGPTDEEVLAKFILRIAMSDPSEESNPVLQGVFALASLQLHGTRKSFRYKRLVVSTVREPMICLDEKTLLQSLMSMMLLYHYELSLQSNSKGSWVVFFCAVKRIINTSPAMHKLLRQEYSVFLDWIYYHEALAEFTVRHWKVPYEGCGYAPVVRSPRPRDLEIENTIIGCPIDVLELVVHTCRLAIVPLPSELLPSAQAAGRERTKMLEKKVSSVVGDHGPLHIPSTIPIDRNIMISDLHRLACMLYVNRAVHRVLGTEFRHRRLVREGILLLTKAKTCQHAWPLFIIACEAADDEQRLAILDVFEQSRLDRRRRSSHIHFIQHLVEAMWNQHDLNDEENPVDYLTIMDAIVGGVSFMPLFA